MTSREFIKEVSDTTGMTQIDLRKIASAFEFVLKKNVERRQKITLAGITLEVKDVAERVGFNPAKGEKQAYAATKKISTKLSSSLKRIAKGLETVSDTLNEDDADTE